MKQIFSLHSSDVPESFLWSQSHKSFESSQSHKSFESESSQSHLIFFRVKSKSESWLGRVRVESQKLSSHVESLFCKLELMSSYMKFHIFPVTVHFICYEMPPNMQ